MSAIQIAQKKFHFVFENDPENKVLRKFEESDKKVDTRRKKRMGFRHENASKRIIQK